jgi:ribosomal protein S18 acetylase RimI-like enzyme
MVCLYEIGVLESRRRQGVGTALVEALLDIAAALDATKTWTVTHRSNGAAMGLFRETGGVPEAAENDADQVLSWRRPD